MNRTVAKPRKWNSDTVFTSAIYVLMFLIIIVMLYPLLIVLSSSVSDPQAILNGEVRLLPVGFSLESYGKVLENEDIVNGFFNSVKYTVVGSAVNVALTVLAAYPLSRRDLKGRNVLMKLITFTMFFSGGMVPSFLIVRELNLMNTMWALILPGAISTYNLIITRTFFENNIPGELQEAAVLDGCSNFRFLLSIVLPLSMTILVIITMFYAVGHWNTYLNAIMYFSKKELYPLQVVLRDILQSSQAADMAGTDTVMSTRFFEIERIKYATMVISSLPLVIVYPFIMKYFEKGVMVGALKG